MQLHIASKHLAASAVVALDTAGREHLVIVAKATWTIPEPGQRPRPLPPQPIVTADEYLGTPGESAMRYGADLARHKARCDVLFDACAHSPNGQPVTKLTVQLQVGRVQKSVQVVGARHWQRLMGVVALSDPNPFTKMPLHHGLAYGGTRWYDQATAVGNTQRLCEAHLPNPAGLGFVGKRTNSQVHGLAAPCLEQPGRPVREPDGGYEPVALSAIGRHWAPRRQWAGTYDSTWRRDVFPLLPSDFDEQFHQCAPADQQMPYPEGAEPVRLRNMMAGRPDVAFALPSFKQQVRVLRTDYSTASPTAVVDTLFFETEAGRFSAVWRASVPIRRRIQEIDSIAIGAVDPLWWQDKLAGRDGRGCFGCSAPAPTTPVAANEPR